MQRSYMALGLCDAFVTHGQWVGRPGNSSILAGFLEVLVDLREIDGE